MYTKVIDKTGHVVFIDLAIPPSEYQIGCHWCEAENRKKPDWLPEEV